MRESSVEAGDGSMRESSVEAGDCSMREGSVEAEAMTFSGSCDV